MLKKGRLSLCESLGLALSCYREERRKPPIGRGLEASMTSGKRGGHPQEAVVPPPAGLETDSAFPDFGFGSQVFPKE